MRRLRLGKSTAKILTLCIRDTEPLGFNYLDAPHPVEALESVYDLFFYAGVTATL